MFSNIVVGTDGSGTAQKAVAAAIDLARQDHARLHLVNAYREHSGAVAAGGTGLAAAGDSGVYRALSRTAGERMLSEMAEGLEGIEVEAHAEGGPAADVIVRVAEQVDADLIVVGSKGMQGARRMIGSVPNSVAHNAPCAVLIVKTA